MNIQTRKMSSERQWGNQGKLGFVPTSREIVELELGLIDFSEITSNEYPINICDLSGGTGDQIHWTNKYLDAQGVRSNVYYNELATERYYECVKNYPYMNHLNADMLHVKVGSKDNRSFNKKVFNVIRNNPPYMWIEKMGSNVRAEQEFFIKNSLLDVAGGIHIMEVPIHQLIDIPNFIQILAYRYELFIAKFPKGEFEKFKQVAVVMKKKKSSSYDKEVIDYIKDALLNDDIPYIDEVEGTVFKVSAEDFKKTKDINIFRENKITEDTLSKGLYSVLGDLLDADKKENKLIVAQKGKPVIEHLVGHVSQLLASGRYDGLMNNLLIRGGANKIVRTETITEDNKQVTTESEVLQPFIEITNKNGDILYKDF